MKPPPENPAQPKLSRAQALALAASSGAALLGLTTSPAQALGPQEVLVIADSQASVDGTQAGQARSWIGQGISQAGYQPIFRTRWGMGASTGYSYRTILAEQGLPAGRPAFIYLAGSGNDLNTGRNLPSIIQAYRELIGYLRAHYPGTPILLTEVLSRQPWDRGNHHTSRHQLSQELAQLAAQEGTWILPSRHWVTDKQVSHLLMDDVHLSQVGHNALAPHLAAWIRWTTGRGFADVLPHQAFYQEINWMRTSGISTGWADGTYRPYQTVLRGEIAAFFYRLAGSPAYAPPATSPFIDVPTHHHFYREIAWMRARGISTGWADGTYRPDQPVLRDQMAAFFYRFKGTPAYTPPATSPFIDVYSSQVFYKEISWMRASGISTGWADGTYRPYQAVLRDQMAAFTYRASRI